MHGKVGSAELGARCWTQIQTEYAAYDHARREAVALYDAGHPAEAKTALLQNHTQAQRLRDLFAEFGRAARADAETTLSAAERSVRRLADVLVATSVAGAVASLLVGFLWARRITKPIYRARGAGRIGGRTNAHSSRAGSRRARDAGRSGERHRRKAGADRRGAVRAPAAPGPEREALGGRRAGRQAGARGAEPAGRHEGGDRSCSSVKARRRPAAGRVVETAHALDREITRVEGLVRRLMNYARPLAPRFELCTVGSSGRRRAGGRLALPCAPPHRVRAATEGADLPPLEVDPQLITQALRQPDRQRRRGDRLRAAARSRWRRRARPSLGATRSPFASATAAPGSRPSRQRELFKPFFTTKPEGHGFGLAVSQNILLEHGGRIVAANRADAPGAVFELQIPVVR